MSRPIVMATTLTLGAILVGQLPATSQSPSAPATSVVPGPSVVPGSAAPNASAVPVDVAAIEWRRAKKSKGFDPDRAGGPEAVDLAVGPDGRFLLVGTTYDIYGGAPVRAVAWGSDDGVRWSPLKGKTPDASGAHAVAVTDTGFLVAGDTAFSAPLLRVSDGTRLRALDAPEAGLPTGALYDLARTPVGLVAAGQDAGGKIVMWRSDDEGVSWTGSPLPDALYVAQVAVTDDGTIVALCNQGADFSSRIPTAWSSSDGVTWTTTAFPLEGGNNSVPDLERTPVGLVATVVTDSSDGTAWLSRDGVTWDQVLEAPGRLVVGTAGTEAIVFGTDAWWHSADGTQWTKVDAPEFGGFVMETSAVRPDGAVVVVGHDGQSGAGTVRSWVGRAPAP
jgi:hypothetical protein